MPVTVSGRKTMVPHRAKNQRERGHGMAKGGHGTAKGSHGMVTRSSGMTSRGILTRRCWMGLAVSTPSIPAGHLSTPPGTAVGTSASPFLEAVDALSGTVRSWTLPGPTASCSSGPTTPSPPIAGRVRVGRLQGSRAGDESSSTRSCGGFQQGVVVTAPPDVPATPTYGRLEPPTVDPFLVAEKLSSAPPSHRHGEEEQDASMEVRCRARGTARVVLLASQHAGPGKTAARGCRSPPLPRCHIFSCFR